jgi:hypothetical protein
LASAKALSLRHPSQIFISQTLQRLSSRGRAKRPKDLNVYFKRLLNRRSLSPKSKKAIISLDDG